MIDHICECPDGGFCAKFNRHMHGRLHSICKGEPCDLTETRRQEFIETLLLRNKVPSSRANVKNRSTKIRSTVGARLIAAFETAIGKHIGCGDCKRFFMALTQTDVADTANLIDRIYRVGLPIPHEIREQHKGAEKERAWIAAVVASVDMAEQLEHRRHVRTSHKAVSEAKPPARFTFVSNPLWTSQVRHLTFHIWATKKHDGWKWNLQQLARRWSLFNGVKIMAVALSPESETAATIVDYASSHGIAFDHVIGIQNNKKLREVVTWGPMLEFLNPEQADQNEVVFSCHAKGVRHSALTSTLETWARIMYEACLDDWPAVENQLSKFLATGAFKRYNNFTTPGNDCWHYSGTFFWWRLRDLGQRDWRKIDQKFFGTESWLGLHCKREETGCLFMDETHNLYDANYMQSIEQQWKAQHAT